MLFNQDLDLSKYLSILAFSLFVCWAIFKWFQSKSYPPGPTGLPIIGYGIFLGKKPNVTLQKLSKKYGDILSFYTGPQLTVIISEYKLAKEILNMDLTLSRPPDAFKFLRGMGGFSGVNGEEWQEQRRFVMQTMRNLGLGRGLWETLIQEETRDFIEEIRGWKGKPRILDGPLQISQAVSNVALLFGRRLDKEASKNSIAVILRSNRILMEYLSSVSINIVLPWLAKILKIFKISGYDKFMRTVKEFESIFSRELELRMKSEDEYSKEDFIACYLKEMEKRKNEAKTHYFTIDNLLGNLFLMFIAANDTTLASISWLLLLMAEHKDIQNKIHDEIDAAFGRDGTIYYDDKGKLPYTQATILEMTRWVSISALFPPRYPTETFEFHGHTIPKGSHIVCNAWAIMHDPRYFEEPMKFKPERFLLENGTKVSRQDGYAAFSFGKRNCPGEYVAMMTIYLYFVSIMQKFQVKPKPGAKVNFEPVFGGAVLTRPQELCFEER